MVRPITLGSGEVRSDLDRPIIHFGSPPGASYGPVEEDSDEG
jgi:hypothetical protein